MMHALSVTRHLLADHAGGIGICGGTAYLAYAIVVQLFHFEGASAGAVVRTGAMEHGRQGFVYAHRRRSRTVGSRQSIVRYRKIKARWWPCTVVDERNALYWS